MLGGQGIAVDAGGTVWYSPSRMGRDGSLIFAEKPRFERKRAKLTLDAASRFLFLGSREDICRVPVCVRSRTGRYGVHI